LSSMASGSDADDDSLEDMVESDDAEDHRESDDLSDRGQVK